jgi:hypothetical protein
MRSAAISAYTLDLLRTLSATMSASTLERANATSVAVLDTASSAAILERRNAFSVSIAARVLYRG